MSPPTVVTLGCRVNAVESEVMRREATAAGVSDAVIVNTCAVTGEAIRQARQMIRRLRRKHPTGRIIVTGCAAQLSPETFAAMPEVDRVVGNLEKMNGRNLIDDDRRIVVSDIMAAPAAHGYRIDGLEGRTRAFVQVQQGCDHRCTFCIVPFARGPNRSVPVEGIVEQVAMLVGNGYREVVFTGVDICSYGSDLADRPQLGTLLRTVLARVPDLPRLRLSTVDPAAIDETVFAVLAEDERLMPHLHLSLQAADDMVLKRMKRRHDRRKAEEVVERARAARPGVVFGADLIAGFPTETDAMFANTLAAVADFGLTYLHVFPFSPRAGTPAARMPQVPAAVRKARAAALRETGARALRHHFDARIGTTAMVLVEKERAGRCPDYAPVSLSFDASAGALVPAHITGATNDHLLGASAS
jgi:threonylcarbamoyladenosine tRNA methylthiotransferase MtaB